VKLSPGGRFQSEDAKDVLLSRGGSFRGYVALGETAKRPTTNPNATERPEKIVEPRERRGRGLIKKVDFKKRGTCQPIEVHCHQP
jgi:hypothetical protein